MKGQSKAIAHFKVSSKTSKGKPAPHASHGPAVPPEYAHNLSVANRASSRAMRVARRGR